MGKTESGHQKVQKQESRKQPNELEIHVIIEERGRVKEIKFNSNLFLPLIKLAGAGKATCIFIFHSPNPQVYPITIFYR